jgi:hypothetical protein
VIPVVTIISTAVKRPETIEVLITIIDESIAVIVEKIADLLCIQMNGRILVVAVGPSTIPRPEAITIVVGRGLVTDDVDARWI